MRYTILLPEPRPGIDVSPDDLVAAAEAVEQAGFDGVWLTDHPFPIDAGISLQSDKEGTVKMGTGHQAFDMLIALAWIGQATKNLILHAHALVLPYRNPFHVAKSIATVDHLCKGRLITTLAAGYLEAEFDALGADFAARDEIMEESLPAMEAAWTGRPVQMSSPRWKANGNVALPAPDPRPTLWRGGNSRKAIDHAARHFDGWAPFEAVGENAKMTRTASLDAHTGLMEKISLFRQKCAEAGRPDDLDVCLGRVSFDLWTGRSRDEQREELAGLEDAGVNWLSVGLITSERDEFMRRLETVQKVVF